jgi:tRNA A-37 threonylcarbamoyl transferase component Bud32/energy-coupling factor transporter ATP-binding protein EcfA2
MGEVLLARDLRLGRRVALKFLLKVDERRSARFLVEARATAQLTHENLVSLHDVAEHEGRPYMVLEYVPGKTLAAWLRERRSAAGGDPGARVPPVSPARAAELMLPVARALVRAHAAGIVHRDLKPENIMLGDGGAVKVLDLGLAKLLDDVDVDVDVDALGDAPPASEAPDNVRGALTHPGAMMGTLQYMSPEQWGEDAVDARTDLWAMGIVLYEMVTGEHPLAPLSMLSMARVTLLDEPMPSVRERLPSIGRMGIVIDRCLIKRKADRLGSAEELCAELAAVARPGASAAQEAHGSHDPHDPHEEGNPYAGLSAFQERDAGRFFGRERSVAQVVARLAEQPLVAVVGPSGAGKSSLVRAGVIPALKRADEAWETFVLRPGSRPLSALAELLLQPAWQQSGEDREPLGDRDALAARLRQEPGLLGVAMRARARRRLERILLFVDQFEELVTLAAEDERAAFLACLIGVADDASSPLRVIVSVRQDFLDRVTGTEGELSERMSRGAVLIAPMSPSDMRRALTKPAELRGHAFESEALVDAMLAELGGASGSLPLLQFTASRLWDERDRERRVLTEASYRAFGGVGGALAGHADSVLAGLRQEERRWARVILVRLVTPERTRALLTLHELGGLAGGMSNEIESKTQLARVLGLRVLGRLIDARLVTVSDAGEGESTVELVHESLIARWPTLVRWLDEAPGDAQLRARLRGAAKEWEASGEAEGLLWRGEAAEEARRFQARQAAGAEAGAELSAREARYLAAVTGFAQRARRLRRASLGAVFTLLCGVVVAVSTFAYRAGEAAKRALAAEQEAVLAQKKADSKAIEASDARLLAGFRELKNSGQVDWAKKLLVEVQHPQAARGWVALASEALRTSVAPRQRSPFFHSAAFDGSGQGIIAAYDDGRARLVRLSREEDPVVFDGHNGWIASAALSPDEQWVVTTSFDGTASLWREGGKFEKDLKGHTGPVRAAAWSPDSARLVTASDDRTARVWRLGSAGEAVTLSGHANGLTSVAWSPDGQRIVTTSLDHTARVWREDGTFERALEGHGGEVYAAAIRPDGQRLVTTSADGTAQLWNMASGAPVAMLEHGSPVVCARFSADGERLATSALDGKVRVWPTDGRGEPIELEAKAPTPMLALTFVEEGRALVGVGEDDTTYTWRIDIATLRAGLAAASAECLPVEMRMTYLGEKAEVARATHARCEAAHGQLPLPALATEPVASESDVMPAPAGPKVKAGGEVQPVGKRGVVFVVPGDAVVEVDGKPVRRRDGVIEVLFEGGAEKRLVARSGLTRTKVGEKSLPVSAGARPLVVDLNQQAAPKGGKAKDVSFGFDD